jgi:hypothetical protein
VSDYDAPTETPLSILMPRGGNLTDWQLVGKIGIADEKN